MVTSTVVALTGCCGGIGSELVKEFISRGHKVIGLDFNQDALISLEDKNIGNFHPYFCDLTQRDSFHKVLGRVREENADIWINNAGIAVLKPYSETTADEFDSVMAVNFRAVDDGTRYWLPLMEKKGQGSIVNIASMASYFSAPLMASYAASKAAVRGLTESLQHELEITGSPVKSILVCPGFVDTKIIQRGTERGFPDSLKWMLTPADKCGKRIVDGILNGERFIDPTMNGKVMMAMGRLAPGLTRLSGKLVATRDLKTLFGKGKSNI